jgi:HPt (histidine-containing phosphotransfer) domain-containing protein
MLPPELATLAGTAGLDPVVGLRQCGSRVAMYRHLLTRFVELYAEPLPAPRAAEGAADMALRDSAHSLRGASATIGAGQIQALSAALEALCDDPAADIAARRQAHAALSEAVSALTGRLRERLAAGDAPKPG